MDVKKMTSAFQRRLVMMVGRAQEDAQCTVILGLKFYVQARLSIMDQKLDALTRMSVNR
jgi:hypothetical protein